MMNAKQIISNSIKDNFEYFATSGCSTVAEYILLNDENNGLFDAWDDEEQGMTEAEYKAWVNETYNISVDDPDLEDKLDNIKYNN